MDDTMSRVEPIPVPIEPPRGHWLRESGHSPAPVSPLSRQLWRHTEWVREAAAEQGVLLDTVGVTEIGGWIYIRPIPLIDRPNAAPPPEWAVPMLFRVVPSLRRRARRAVAAQRSDAASQVLGRWEREWRGSLTGRAATLRDVDLGSVSDAELRGRLAGAGDLAADAGAIHFRVLLALAVGIGSLEFFCREHLGWPAQRSLELLAGTSATSTAPVVALTRLAEVAAGSGAVTEQLERRADLNAVLAADAGFALAFADHQRSFGHRCLGTDLLEPALVERPEIALALVRDRLDPSRRTAEVETLEQADRTSAEAREALGHGSDRDEFEDLLARGRRAYAAREECDFHTISVPYAILRLTALEVGRRLAAEGRCTDPEDVFFLEAAELDSALASGSRIHTVVRRRRAEYAWALANPGPPSYGVDPGPPPDLRRLSSETRIATESVVWMLEQIEGAPDAHRAAIGQTLVSGLAAAPGIVRGPARIVRDETDFPRLQPGDVLVCPTTSPVWSVLFANAAALVTDSGGILSHPAIIAREFGVPAVTGCGTATDDLVDGRTVTVDGFEGTVIVEEP